MSRRCGFAAVLGAPNAGKSTLINVWAGGKVSIVSPKPQTTRCLVRGITVHEQSQIVFIDTPGIFKPGKRLERAMTAAAWQGEAEADMTLLVVDASRGAKDSDTGLIFEKLAQRGKERPCVLALNKVDKVKKEKLLMLAKALNEKADFAATFMVSGLTGDGCGDVLDWLAAHAPEGEWHFPADDMTDMPARLLASEITREKLFCALHEELPYALAVETENWEEFRDGSIKINQIIYVARESHKPIVLGKGGRQIGEIGEAARRELGEILETPVHLKLFVKVQENWEDDPEKYRLWGLDYSA